MAQVQMLKGLAFAGIQSWRGNSSPCCCFAVGSLQWPFASSKSHWKIPTGQNKYHGKGLRVIFMCHHTYEVFETKEYLSSLFLIP